MYHIKDLNTKQSFLKKQKTIESKINSSRPLTRSEQLIYLSYLLISKTTRKDQAYANE